MSISSFILLLAAEIVLIAISVSLLWLFASKRMHQRPSINATINETLVEEVDLFSNRLHPLVAHLGPWPLWIAPFLALGLWALSLSRIDTSKIGDFGLAINLPWSYTVGMAVLVIGFAALMARNPVHTGPWLGHILVLILILHGTLPFVYDAPRFDWTYKHLGVVNYIAIHGRVDSSIDAYHNWPGFFAFAALIDGITGLGDPIHYAKYAQLGFNLLYLAPLVLIFRALIRNRRGLWLAVWFFYMTNWVSQDYFSPQAMNFFFFLTIIGIFLTWFGRNPEPQPTQLPTPLMRFLPPKLVRFVHVATSTDFGPPPAPVWTMTQRVMAGIAILSFAVVSGSHQLTPFMLIAMIAVLTGLRRNAAPFMLVVLIGTVAFWDSTFAYPYLQAHTHWYSTFGRLFGNIGANLSPVNVPNQDVVLIRLITRMFSLSVWVLGVLGVLLALRNHRLPGRALVLALSPFMLIVFGDYGGEMIFRMFLFSLPFTVVLAALALRSKHPTVRFATTLGVSLTFCAGFLVAYLGDERLNHVQLSEVNTIQALYREAPKGAALAAMNYDFVPVRGSAYYAEYRYDSVIEDAKEKTSIAAISALVHDYLTDVSLGVRSRKLPGAYFIFSARQRAYLERNHVMSGVQYDEFESKIAQSKNWRVFRASRDMIVYVYSSGSVAAARVR